MLDRLFRRLIRPGSVGWVIPTVQGDEDGKILVVHRQTHIAGIRGLDVPRAFECEGKGWPRPEITLQLARFRCPYQHGVGVANPSPDGSFGVRVYDVRPIQRNGALQALGGVLNA